MSHAAAANIPVGLKAQFVRHAPRYAIGLILLGAYQFAQYWFDTRLRLAINAALAHESRRATILGITLVVVACSGLAVRVLSWLPIDSLL